MKKHIRLLNVLSVSLVLSAPLLSLASGGDNRKEYEDVKKQRLINRSYNVTAEDQLKIDNQFGDVTVSTWDQPKITVDIEIGARAYSDEKAQNILDQIDVKDSQSGHVISFKTTVGEIHSQNGSRHSESDNRSFYIDYVIHMPAVNPLAVQNNFGKTLLPDLKGLVNVTSKYGSLTAGKLDNVEAIDVEFGKASIGEVTNGKVVFQYDGESRIGKINGIVKIVSEYSSRLLLNVADNVQELTVLESYSGLRMTVGKSLSAQIDIHTNFGEFHNESDFAINEKKEDEGDLGPHFDKDYSGMAGDGKAKIRVKSSFGSLRLSNPNGDDDDRYRDRDKHKDKNKDKDKDKDKDNDGDSSGR